MRETLTQAGYTLDYWEDDDTVILRDDDTNQLERWIASPHHAGYSITINGRSFEFVSSNVNH